MLPADTNTSVSYTHLYLWKFVWKFGAFAMLIVIGSMSFTQKISLVRVMAVSYTHLDVYKRQTYMYVVADVSLDYFEDFQ